MILLSVHRGKRSIESRNYYRKMDSVRMLRDILVRYDFTITLFNIRCLSTVSLQTIHILKKERKERKKKYEREMTLLLHMYFCD